MITAFYALPLVVLYLWLATRVVNFRKAKGISLGDGGHEELVHRIRAHGNCAEYAPLGLLLLALAELSQVAAPLVHLCGLALVTGRFVHAWAIGWRGPFAARVAGMMLTFSAMGVSALAAAIAAL